MGAWLLLPFFLIRFGLLSRLNKDAVSRAAHFAPMRGHEKAAYWIYQVSNGLILILLFFLPIRRSPVWLCAAGVGVYLAGLALLTASVAAFAAPAESGFSQGGLYRFSRNPMYAAYFVFFTGCALLTRSPALFGLVLVFQISAHWIIRAEERWCAGQFGEAYLQYMKRVRRYI